MNSWDVSLFKWDEQENDLPQNSHFYFWRFHELQECLYALHECLGCVSTENTNRFVMMAWLTDFEICDEYYGLANIDR